MKDTPENRLKDAIKLGLSSSGKKASRWPGLRLFGNPRGTAFGATTAHGKPSFISYGLAPGSKELASSDMIGWRTIEITPAMVGHKIAQFVSVEAKAPGKKATKEQLAWLEMVQAAGGLIGLVQNVDQIDLMMDGSSILMNIPVESDA